MSYTLCMYSKISTNNQITDCIFFFTISLFEENILIGLQNQEVAI